MKELALRRLLALCLALMLMIPALALAEDALVSGETPEAEVPEVAGSLGGEAVLTSNAAKSAIPSKLTLGVKEKYTIDTSGLTGALTFKSSKAKVAAVSAKGVITGKKAGTAKITVTPKGGAAVTITVTVKKAPSKVTLNKKTATVKVGKTLQLKATLPSKTASNQLTWSSDKPKVAKVDENGKVTAVAPGTATITVKTFNGKKATCKVSVTVTYRALLIGQENFSDDYCPRNRGDVKLMTNMLNSVKGLYGGSFTITKKYDQSRSQVLSAISSAFAGATADDVSLFFIASHGVSNEYGYYAGALAMCPEGILPLPELAEALKAVPGKVIVLIESCGSGAAVYGNGKSASAESAAVAFDQAVVNAFAEADPGIEVEVLPGNVASDGLVKNTGEFRQENKFYVLTASRHLEDSWGAQNWNFFTKWLTDGIATKGKMPADANKNGQTTLNELYKYISKVGDNYPFYYSYSYYYQHVQVYPANSNYVLFVR